MAVAVAPETRADVDVISHGLWAAFGTAVAMRRFALSRRTVTATIVLAVAPDLVHVPPVAWWALFDSGSYQDLAAYLMLTSKPQPVLPPAVELWSHSLHCTMHSGIVAVAMTLLIWLATRSLWIPLLGWWSHILIDVFTHSADFDPSPVLYPFTRQGFDGIAWNEPWLMILNYASLAAAFAWLWTRQRVLNRA